MPSAKGVPPVRARGGTPGRDALAGPEGSSGEQLFPPVFPSA
ncbi:hypothetical protein [Leucobacter sp. UCD-THU]|nr:hypothetical protein [Leucobacter sp. UCD-THU]